MSTRRLCVGKPLAAGGIVRLGAKEAHYVGRVLRCRPGDELTLFNGDGSEYPSRIAELDGSGIRVTVGEPRSPRVESPLDLRLIQCVARGERMDTVVQKATELGVRRISPALSERSVVRFDRSRAARRHEHWLRIARSACEQCGRNVPPLVDAPFALEEALAEDGERTRLMPARGAAASLSGLALPAGGIDILIGPEGGLAGDERDAAEAAGFVAVSLGPRTLRTETAAIAALTLAQALWGDLHRARTG